MLSWMGFLFQDGFSFFMQTLDWFYDYLMFFLIMILMFVVMFIFFIFSNKFINFFKFEFQYLEFLWTISPCFLLVILGFPSLEFLYKSELISNYPILSVKIMGHQWYWSYDYSDFNEVEFDSYLLNLESIPKGFFRLLETDNRIIVPFKSWVRFIISSSDVLHSWAIPSLGMKVDANPGRLNQIFNFIMSSGIFYGQCSEICGANHSFMPIVMESTSNSLFKEWINSF